MVTITSLEKKEAVLLETSTTPLLNLFFKFYIGATAEHPILVRYKRLVNWNRTEDFKPRFKDVYQKYRLKDNVTLVEKVLCLKPLFFRNYESRTAVFGLKISGVGCLAYYSERGLSFQAENNITQEQFTDIINTLYELIFRENL